MCRFIAVVSREPFDPSPYIQEVEKMARYGRRAEHGDGWGVWIKNDEYQYLHKETLPIWKRTVQNFPEAKILFVHARKKGRGAEIALENTHPFLSKGAVFMHNGLIEISHEESCGETDSERLFMNILHRGLWNVLCEIEKYEFTSVNSVLYNRGKIYAIRYAKKDEDYYTLYIRREGDRVVISTEGPGEEIENGTVLSMDEDGHFEVLPFCPNMFR